MASLLERHRHNTSSLGVMRSRIRPRRPRIVVLRQPRYRRPISTTRTRLPCRLDRVHRTAGTISRQVLSPSIYGCDRGPRRRNLSRTLRRSGQPPRGPGTPSGDAPDYGSPSRDLEPELHCRPQSNYGAALQRDRLPFGDRLAIDRRAEGALVILGGESPTGESDRQMLAGHSD